MFGANSKYNHAHSFDAIQQIERRNSDLVNTKFGDRNAPSSVQLFGSIKMIRDLIFPHLLPSNIEIQFLTR